jgi:hypothetical protein
MNYPETDVLTALVSQVLHIDDITTGDPQKEYLVRYRGKLKIDSAEAYDKISASLSPYHLTPLFREQEEWHVILLMPGVIEARPANPWVNLVLFLLTLLSVIFAGAFSSYQGDVENLTQMMLGVLGSLASGIPFAISLLAILLAHEFGHYLAGRYHRTNVTLPYFIPFPFSPFGTMGAFIQLKEPPRNKRILLDIGIAGPLAGLVIAVPVLLLGLSLFDGSPIEIPLGTGVQLEGQSLLYLLAKYVVFGQLCRRQSATRGKSAALLDRLLFH